MRNAIIATSVVLALVGSSRAQAQDTRSRPAVTYASFMQQDYQGRLSTLARITPENRADLALTHLSRWIAVNQSYLADEQQRVLTNFIKVAAPPLFRIPGERDTLAWRNELAARVTKLFSQAQVRQAFTETEADYIPLQWPSKQR